MRFITTSLVAISIMTLTIPATYANDDYKKLDVNCDTLNVGLGDSVTTELTIRAFWKKPAVFPNPPLEDSIKNYKPPFAVECPKISIYDNGNVVEIKAKDYKSLIDLIPSYSRKFNLYGTSGYIYQYIKEGFYFHGYSIDLENFTLNAGIYSLKEGADLLKGYNLHFNIPNGLVLAYRTDNGELKPMIYDYKVSKYKADFKKAKVIDIYQKLDKPLVVERLTIDKSSGSIKMYRKHPFPES